MVIDELAKDARCLMTCSLVSRGWRPRALSYLFRSIRICEDKAVVSPGGPTQICRVSHFARLQKSMPHLLLYLRRLEFYSPHTRDRPRSPETWAILEFFADLSLHAPVRVEKLSFFGQAPWNLYLTGLSERLPCVRHLWIEQLTTITVPDGALRNVVTLDVGLDSLARFPRATYPDDDFEPTPIKQLNVRMLSCGALWYIGYYISSVRKRAPQLEHISIVEEIESDPLEDDFISEFLTTTAKTRRLIQSIDLKLVAWRPIAPARLHRLLRHCSRLRALRFVIALARIHPDPLPPLTDLPYLQRLEIAFTEVEKADQLSVLPTFGDWAELETALLSSAEFTRLSVTLEVRRSDTSRANVALAELEALLPALHCRGMLHTDVREGLQSPG